MKQMKKIKRNKIIVIGLIIAIGIFSGCIFSDDFKSKEVKKNKSATKIQISPDIEGNVTLKYFWSPYCPTCKEQEPILQEFLDDHPKLDFIRINIEKKESRPEMKKYGIVGVPAFVVIRGEVVKIASGLLSKQEIIALICPKLKDEKCLIQLEGIGNVSDLEEVMSNISKKVVEPIVDKEENITRNQSTSERKPYGDDVKYFSYDPVITWESLPESQEIEYIKKEDKVIFKFLYSPSCPICKKAMAYVPKIKKEFGERVIVENINLYKEKEEKWYKAAKKYGPQTRWFPYTLSIGRRSLVNDEIKLDLIPYTDNFKGAITINQWRKNICNQFEKKPEICG